jgi:hypothetical protein
MMDILLKKSMAFAKTKKVDCSVVRIAMRLALDASAVLKRVVVTSVGKRVP